MVTLHTLTLASWLWRDLCISPRRICISFALLNPGSVYKTCWKARVALKKNKQQVYNYLIPTCLFSFIIIYLKNPLLYNVITSHTNLEWDYFFELINLNSHSLFKIDSHGVRRPLCVFNKESTSLTGAVTISQYDSALSDGCTIHQVLISVIKICHSRIYDNLFIQELPRTLVTIWCHLNFNPITAFNYSNPLQL